MYIHIYICIYMYIYVHVYRYIYTYTHISRSLSYELLSLFLSLSLSLFLYMHIHTHISMSLSQEFLHRTVCVPRPIIVADVPHKHTCEYKYIYIYIYICICIYINIIQNASQLFRCNMTHSYVWRDSLMYMKYHLVLEACRASVILFLALFPNSVWLPVIFHVWIRRCVNLHTFRYRTCTYLGKCTCVCICVRGCVSLRFYAYACE